MYVNAFGIGLIHSGNAINKRETTVGINVKPGDYPSSNPASKKSGKHHSLDWIGPEGGALHSYLMSTNKKMRNRLIARDRFHRSFTPPAKAKSNPSGTDSRREALKESITAGRQKYNVSKSASPLNGIPYDKTEHKLFLKRLTAYGGDENKPDWKHFYAHEDVDSKRNGKPIFRKKREREAALISRRRDRLERDNPVKKNRRAVSKNYISPFGVEHIVISKSIAQYLMNNSSQMVQGYEDPNGPKFPHSQVMQYAANTKPAMKARKKLRPVSDKILKDPKLSRVSRAALSRI